MSVKRVEVASVQFQIESRQANASIKALEAEAEVLNKKMAETKASIKALGDVPEDNPQLLAFQKQAKQLKRDVDDVNKTIKDYTRGVKAADELLRNYDRQTIESMSMKAIKAGQNGLKKRIENIDPDKANAEELKAYRIIQEVIRESQRVVDDFRADYAETIRILKEGGTVSEQTMKRTRDALKDLMEGEREGTQLHAEYRQQYEFMVAKVNEYALDIVQLHGHEHPDYVSMLRADGGFPAVMKALSIATPADMAAYQHYEGLVDYFLFDTKCLTVGGSGRHFDWNLLAAYDGKTPFLLSGGLGPNDAPRLHNFLASSNPAAAHCVGIDLNSRFEHSPGHKDITKLKAFIQSL